jgi:YHS domain-containing protein
MLQGILRVILYIFLFYLIYHIFRFFKSLSSAKKSRSYSKALSGMMVKDEYCNTYLPKEDAIKENIDGKEFYFCSKECRQKFLETKRAN